MRCVLAFTGGLEVEILDRNARFILSDAGKKDVSSRKGAVEREIISEPQQRSSRKFRNP
jgi:hypothetical protein